VGQTLYCVTGIGRIQLEGKQVQELHPGDTAVIPPNTRHWHGAAPDEDALQLTIYEGSVEWLEPVQDEEYLVTPQR